MFTIIIVLQLLCLFAVLSACSSESDSGLIEDGDFDAENGGDLDDDAKDGPDGDIDVENDLPEQTETENETEPDISSCDWEEPICQGENVAECQNNIVVLIPCESGTYCNYGQCQPSSVVFPQDAGYHTERSEWWYYTGHLSDGVGDWGFEVTIFQYNVEETYGVPGYGYMCHVGVTDKLEKEHYHIDSFSLSPEIWQADPNILEVDNCYFELDGQGHDHIIAHIPSGKEKDGKASPWIIDLTFAPQKRAALHGGDGIIPMSDAGGTSWYYSYTRLSATGRLTTPDGDFGVAGQAWMDHQWGQFDITEFKGWDWWSIQLEQDWEIMLFQFTNWDGDLASQAGTLIDPEGNQTELDGFDAFSVISQRTWESPHTDGIYPLDWNITIGAQAWSLNVTTSVDDQEMYNAAQNYWEGETTVTGNHNNNPVSGVGYTELTGYATDFLDPKPSAR
jgi:predicted secreted hydrolase